MLPCVSTDIHPSWPDAESCLVLESKQPIPVFLSVVFYIGTTKSSSLFVYKPHAAPSSVSSHAQYTLNSSLDTPHHLLQNLQTCQTCPTCHISKSRLPTTIKPGAIALPPTHSEAMPIPPSAQPRTNTVGSLSKFAGVGKWRAGARVPSRPHPIRELPGLYQEIPSDQKRERFPPQAAAEGRMRTGAC